MNNGMSLHRMVLLAALPALLLGCTPLAASPTSTASPPMLTPDIPSPLPPQLLTSSESLVGIWRPLSSGHDSMFLRIDADGTCRQSFSEHGLADAPEVECTYLFEGSNFVMTVVKLNGVPPCPSASGRYEVELLAENHVELTPTNDTCGPRVGSTRGEYQRIP